GDRARQRQAEGPQAQAVHAPAAGAQAHARHRRLLGQRPGGTVLHLAPDRVPDSRETTRSDRTGPPETGGQGARPVLEMARQLIQSVGPGLQIGTPMGMTAGDISWPAYAKPAERTERGGKQQRFTPPIRNSELAPVIGD